jgi:hypothetical protein
MLNRLSGRIDRRLAIGLAGVALLLGTLLFLSRFGDGAVAEKPSLTVMSSIPLQWGEANMTDIANGKAQPSPLFAHLSKRNRVMLVDDFQKLGAPGAAPLLLIQPRALAPRELVELDAWIRKGGSAIIFADPALDWPSDLPLGDQRRPLFTSLLTPMFRHWGLELALPVSEEPQADEVIVGEYRLSPNSAGIWMASKGKPSARCTISADEMIANCQVGKGRALLVADADLLYYARWTDGIMTPGTVGWLDAVLVATRRAESLPDSLWAAKGK